MTRPLHILLSLDHATAFDRRAFDGITAVANARRDIRLVRREYETPFPSKAVRPLDGVIISRIVEKDAMARLAGMNVPFVSLADNLPPTNDRHYIVAMDEPAIGRMAARHFLDAGYKNFAVICRPGVRDYFAQRIGAFRDAVHEAGHDCAIGPPACPPPESPQTTAYDGELTWWDAELDAYLKTLRTPLAVFAPYDYYAQTTVNTAWSVGLRVPDDVAVIGVDDDEQFCMTTAPQLCSVMTPARRIGQEAVSLLLDVLDGKADVPRRTLLQSPGIMFRGSSSPNALHDPDVISAVRFIRDNAGRGIDVGQVAGHVLLSRRTLERRFMATLSHTIRDEIRRAKISDAKRLLTDTDLPFAEVARRSGLVQQQQLGRQIKLATGMTPVQFRRATRTHRVG